VNTPPKPDPPGDAPPLSLRRWSQRKHAARRDAENVADKNALSAAASSGVALPETSAADARAASPDASPQAQDGPPAAAGADPAPLPPVHTLTPDSDFTRFFDAKAPVDDALKRAALKALLRDPRFNIMDGLDTYIDDYTRSDPIPEGVLQRLAHAQSFITSSPTPEAAPTRVGVDAVPAAAAASRPPAIDAPVTATNAGAEPVSAPAASAEAGKPTA